MESTSGIAQSTAFNLDDSFIQVSGLAVFPRNLWHLALLEHVRGVQENDISIMHRPVITFGSIGLCLDEEAGCYYLQGLSSNEVAPWFFSSHYEAGAQQRVVLTALRWFVERDRRMLAITLPNRNVGASTERVRLQMWKGSDPSEFGIRYDPV